MPGEAARSQDAFTFSLPPDTPHGDALPLPDRPGGFYRSGGTLSPDEPSYVVRDAEGQLMEGLQNGLFCYILTSRQMGKSSLMNYVSVKLQQQDVSVAQLDLTRFGQNLTVEQWYDGLVYEIGRSLKIRQQLNKCWTEHADLGPLHRFVAVLREGVLKECPGKVVIFIDEIDVVRSLKFSSDEFFAAIRECYNRRSDEPDMYRLTFCLAGMATPQDLIRDPRITPFNIGRRIELRDFTLKEALQLAPGLDADGRDGAALLTRVIHWTNGHPYITQKICEAISMNPSVRTRHDIDILCSRMFLSQQARETEANLVPVREYILRSENLRVPALELFQKVIKKRSKVEFDNTNEVANLLQLSGMTRVDNGMLRVRNRIYEEVFDEKWVLSELPEAEARRIRQLVLRARLQTAGIALPIIAIVAGLAGEAIQEARKAQESELNTKHALYVSDMRLASDSLDGDNINDTLELLGNHKDSDIAGFEYGYLWHQTHLATAVCTGHTYYLTSVAFAPSGHFIATSGIDSTVRFWNAQSGRQINSISVAPTSCSTLTFSPDGRWLVLGCIDGSLRIYDTTGRLLLRQLRFPNGSVWSVHFSPDSQMLAAGGNTETAIYNTNTWKPAHIIPSKGLVYSARFDPTDPHEMATADQTGTVRLWNAETGDLIRSFSGMTSATRDVTFSPNGKQLAAGSEDGTVIVWNADTGSRVQTIDNNGQQVSSVCFAPQAGELITADQNATIKYWSIATGRQTFSLHGHTGRIVDLDLSNDGRWLATASWDKTAMVWDTSLRTSDTIPLQRYLTPANTPALSQNGSRAAGLCTAGSIAVWDTTTGTHPRTIYVPQNPGPRNAVPVLAFVPNSDELITVDQRGVAYWNSNTGKGIQKASLTVSGVKAIAVSPDGHSIAVLHYNDPPQIIDVTTHHVITLSVQSNAGLEALAFSRDGTQVAIGLRDGLTNIYDSRTGAEMPKLVGGLRGKISAIAFSPDNRTLAISSEFTSLKIWNLATRHEIMTLTNPTGNIRAITFGDDGKTLKAVSDQGIVKVWRASSVPK